MVLRRALHALGWRFYVDRSPIVGLRSRADIVFPRLRVAVFIDGCFWHGCPLHGTWPVNNAAWWRAKIDGNRARDQRVTATLVESDWTAVRIWEHEGIDDAVARVVEALEFAISRHRG